MQALDDIVLAQVQVKSQQAYEGDRGNPHTRPHQGRLHLILIALGFLHDRLFQLTREGTDAVHIAVAHVGEHDKLQRIGIAFAKQLQA